MQSNLHGQFYHASHVASTNADGTPFHLLKRREHLKAIALTKSTR